MTLANNQLSNPLNAKQKEKYLLSFLIAFFCAALLFLPFVIYDKGYFLFFGDFNVQQVPFYKLAHEAVKSGDIYWNWYTDLGVNFIGSYSFYLLFSPFFWLTLPFPTSIVPYFMAPLLALKFGVMSLTAYTFITRFVKNKNAALIGALLYAFSGFSVYNIFFNHFHDAMAFFPLLLVSLDELVENGRKGLFAICVALCLMVNYFFFVGQVVFVIIYFVIRVISDKNYSVTIKKFLQIAFESVLGVLLVAVVALPSYLAIADNNRVGGFLLGWSTVLYSNEQRYPDIIHSFLFPPDLPSRPNFFPDANAKWSSMAGWFPLFSLSGVIAFMWAKSKHWIKRIIATCIVMAFIPVLNTAFYAFDNSYYARWYYMPILIMGLATAKAIEDPEIDMKKGIRWTVALTVPFVVLGFIPNSKDGEVVFSGVVRFQDRFWAYIAIAFLSLTVLIFIFYFLRKHKHFYRITVASVMAIFLIYSWLFVGLGKTHSYNDEWIINTGIEGREKIYIDDDDFYRVDVYDGMDNQAMFWRIPTIQAFHSIVPPSVMEYYPLVGVERGVGSRPQPEYYGIRALTSTKYLFIDQQKTEYEILPGFEFYSNQNGFDIYVNNYYIPMGFTYDTILSRSQFEQISTGYRHLVQLKAIVLEDKEYEKYKDMFKEADIYDWWYTENEYYKDCTARAENTCYYFEKDNKGFTAKITSESKNLVFFSVPYDEGWSVTVNGEDAQVIKANVGFMAVEVPEGDSEIRFDYTTPGLSLGIKISIVSLCVLVGYVFIATFLDKKKAKSSVVKENSDTQEKGI